LLLLYLNLLFGGLYTKPFHFLSSELRPGPRTAETYIQSRESRWVDESVLHISLTIMILPDSMKPKLILGRADATIASKATGAMSWAFINAMKKNPQQSYVQLLNSIRDELATKYTQKPQLSCSHPLSKFFYERDISPLAMLMILADTNILFVL
jgi:hypothetical protein